MPTLLPVVPTPLIATLQLRAAALIPQRCRPRLRQDRNYCWPSSFRSASTGWRAASTGWRALGAVASCAACRAGTAQPTSTLCSFV